MARVKSQGDNPRIPPRLLSLDTIMITIPEVVEELVSKKPFLEEGLSRGLINLSALARELQPEIEKKLYKEVQTGAIIMALKRLSTKPHSHSRSGNILLEQVIQQLGDMTVRSNIVEFTLANSSTLADQQVQLMHEVSKKPNSFLTITDGVFETAFFASQNLEAEIERLFAGQTVKNKITGLSSITIIIPQEATDIPGVYYSILKKLAWNAINFIEVVSSFTELTIFMRNEDVDRAFSVLKN